jgi:hypothetical protein
VLLSLPLPLAGILDKPLCRINLLATGFAQSEREKDIGSRETNGVDFV